MINTNYDLNALLIFISVYENKGINKASKKLYLSQPAVTIAIKKLEEKLGGKLFIRLAKGIVPTQEGEKFYENVKSGINLIKKGIQNFNIDSALLFGKLNIGASTSIIKNVLMPKIKEFCSQFPNIKVSFTEVISSRLQKYLSSGEIDIAFMDEPTIETKLFDIKNVSVVTNCFFGGINSKIDKITKNNFNDIKFAVLKNNTNSRILFDDLCNKNNLIANICYEMASFETLGQICESNLALGFGIKEFLSNDISTGKIKQIDSDIDLPLNSIYAITPKGNTSGFITNKFLEFFK